MGDMASESIDERFVRQAIELARRLRQAGNHPFGALLALDGAVGFGARDPDRDRSRSDGARRKQPRGRGDPEADPGSNPPQRSLFDCEPCAMCVGKMYWGGVQSLVYALPSEQLAALAARDFVIPCRELFSRSREAVQIVGPVLVEEAREVHVGFWNPAT